MNIFVFLINKELFLIFFCSIKLLIKNSGEADRVGVLRTSSGALHFFVNGIDQGPAATNIPSKVYAVIDMYGKCAQVTIMDDNNRDIGTALCLKKVMNIFSSNMMSNRFYSDFPSLKIEEKNYDSTNIIIESSHLLIFHDNC